MRGLYQPPRKSGQGMKTRTTAIGDSPRLGLPCFWPESLPGNIEEIERLKTCGRYFCGHRLWAYPATRGAGYPAFGLY